MTVGTTFDATSDTLANLLNEVAVGRLQLPDFPRGWVWDDEHIAAVITSVSRSLRPGDVIVGQPLLASPVRTGNHDPVQHGGEDRPLGRELEAAPGQQRLDHGSAAGLLPLPPEQQRRADALAGELAGLARLELPHSTTARSA